MGTEGTENIRMKKIFLEQKIFLSPLTGSQEAVVARRTDGGQAENEGGGKFADFTEEGEGQELPGDDEGEVVDVELHQLRLCPVVEILRVENHQGTLHLRNIQALLSIIDSFRAWKPTILCAITNQRKARNAPS